MFAISLPLRPSAKLSASSPPKEPASKGKAIRTTPFAPDTKRNKPIVKPTALKDIKTNTNDSKKADKHEIIIKHETSNLQKRYLTPSDLEDGSSLRSVSFSPSLVRLKRHADEPIYPTQCKHTKIEPVDVSMLSIESASATRK